MLNIITSSPHSPSALATNLFSPDARRQPFRLPATLYQTSYPWRCIINSHVNHHHTQSPFPLRLAVPLGRFCLLAFIRLLLCLLLPVLSLPSAACPSIFYFYSNVHRCPIKILSSMSTPLTIRREDGLAAGLSVSYLCQTAMILGIYSLSNPSCNCWSPFPHPGAILL